MTLHSENYTVTQNLYIHVYMLCTGDNTLTCTVSQYLARPKQLLGLPVRREESYDSFLLSLLALLER